MAVMLQLITLDLFFDVGHRQRCTISLKMVQQMSSEFSEPHRDRNFKKMKNTQPSRQGRSNVWQASAQ